MGKLIKIQHEEIKPRIVCGKCKKEVLIDIAPFSKDCTKILQDKCPKCNATLYVGIMILSNTSLQGLLNVIQTILGALEKASIIIGGKREEPKL